MINQIKLIIHLIFQIYLLFFGKLTFSETGTGLTMVTGLTSWDKAIQTGVFNQMINVDVGENIFPNRRFRSPIVSIDRLLGKERTGTSTMRGFDKVIIKDILYLPNATDSQTAGQEGEELTLTLNAGDKNNLIEKQVIELDFQPTDENVYTNEVKVSDKVPASATTIKVVATDPTLLIGIESGTPIPAGTLMNILGPMFEEFSDVVEPVSFFPKPFENYVQEFAWSYKYSFLAGKQNLYGPIQSKEGELRKQVDADAKDALLGFIEKSIIFNGKPKKKEILNSTDTFNQYGMVGGLIWSIRHSASPAVVTNYGVWSYSKWEEFEWKFSDVDKDEAYTPFIWCNRAFRKWLTDRKSKDNQAWTWEKVPDDIYGIPGVRYVETDQAKFELAVHPAIHRRWPNMDEPAFIAVTPAMLFIDTMEGLDFQLRANLPTTKRGYISEYYAVMGARYYNLNTAYHGVCLPE
jgi:hypothetical protein